jgi:hypothetical protein
MGNIEIKKAVKQKYSRFAQNNTSCCPTCNPEKNDLTKQTESIEYSPYNLENIQSLPSCVALCNNL